MSIKDSMMCLAIHNFTRVLQDKDAKHIAAMRSDVGALCGLAKPACAFKLLQREVRPSGRPRHWHFGRLQELTSRKVKEPMSLPDSLAAAKARARQLTSPKPRLTPCPARGWTACAASPISAKRGRTYLRANKSSLASGNMLPHPLKGNATGISGAST